MKKNVKESYSMGHYNGMALVPGEPVIVKLPTHVGVSLPISDRSSYTMGDASVKEGEEPLDPDREDFDPNEVFAEKMKRIVAASVGGQPISGGLKGHKDVVDSVNKLLRAEVSYMKELLSGKAAADPQMIKIKELIDSEAAKLKRMSRLIWPFK